MRSAMGAPRIVLLGSIALFGLIGAFGLYKKISSRPAKSIAAVEESTSSPKRAPKVQTIVEPAPVQTITTQPIQIADDLPNIDRTFELFTTGPLKLPIVETVTYSSHVPWLKGRFAWIADYAAHYGTSRHFIARSLNGRADYFTQTVQEGSHFNVFRKDKKIEFYLLVDVPSCKMALYYHDLDTNERVLLKTYKVGLGKSDPTSASGSMTPLGQFMVGDKVAIYKSGMRGFHGNQEVEMVQIFGTRWMPLGNGYGIQGAPWILDPKTGTLMEDCSVIGNYASDGGIRLCHEDLEELFSIVITKPTHVEIVKDLRSAKLPGQEVATPRKS